MTHMSHLIYKSMMQQAMAPLLAALAKLPGHHARVMQVLLRMFVNNQITYITPDLLVKAVILKFLLQFLWMAGTHQTRLFFLD